MGMVKVKAKVKIMKILLVWPNKDQHGFKPLGLSYIAGWLKKHKYKYKLFDTTFCDLGYKTNSETRNNIFKSVDYGVDTSKTLNWKEELNKILISFNPDNIWISALTDEIEIGNKLAVFCHKHDLNFKNSLIKILTFKDYIHWGNWATLNIDKLFGKSYHRQYGYKYLTENIDDLPFMDWDIFDDRNFLKPFQGKAYRGGDFMITHGCPGRCSYCINSTHPQKVESFSVNRAIDEINYLTKKHKLEFWKFHDEDFLLKSKKYMKDFCNKYDKTPFTCMINAKSVTADKVELLKKMGCVNVSIGIETGNEELRDLLGRRETKEDIIQAGAMFKWHGIQTTSFNLLGIPGETEDTLKETVQLNKNAQIAIPNPNFFFPFPETPLRDYAIDNGYYTEEKIFEQGEPALDFPDLSKDTLKYYYNNFYNLVKEEL
jgi:radical SAM superfamily enzyme YgiQ (UPF0313 family)